MADLKIPHGWKTCGECLKPIKKVKGKLTHIAQPEVDQNHEPVVL